MFCLDASVIISAAHGVESHSQRSKAFLDTIRDDETKIFLPELALAEIASGIFRATKNKQFVREFVGSLRALPNVSFVPVDSKLIDLAVTIITETGLRSADAIYVALAHDYHLTLVTLDREQLTKAKKLISVREP